MGAEIVSLQAVRDARTDAGIDTVRAIFRKACNALNDYCRSVVPDQYFPYLPHRLARAKPMIDGVDKRIVVTFERPLAPAEMARMYDSVTLTIGDGRHCVVPVTYTVRGEALRLT